MMWSLRPQSSRAKPKQITIRNDCMGTCATEIRIERVNTLDWQEIHLTREETVDIITALVQALAEPDRE